MSTIASLAVQLTCNPQKFVAGLAVAEKQMKKVGQSGLNPGVWAKMASAGLGKFQGAIDTVVGPIKNLIGSIPLIGGALASFPTSVGGFVSWFQEGSARINEMRVNSLKLGIPIERMAGFMLAGGSSTEAFTMSMFRLQEELGQAAQKAIGTEVTFSRLGLNARELAGLPLDTAFGKIADKINSLQSTSAKGMAAFSLFGKRGAEMLPILARGSAGLEAFQRKAKEMGLSVSGVDAANVLKANMAIKKLDLWMNAAKQSVAVELSPVIIALAEQFRDVGISAKNVGQWAMSGVKVLAYGGAYAIEVWTGLRMVWDMIAIGFKVMAAGIVKGLQFLLEQAGKLPDALGGDTFRQAAASLGGTFEELWSGAEKDRAEFFERMAQPGALQKVDQFFAGVEAKTKAARAKAAKDAANAGQDQAQKAKFERLFALFERGQKLTEDMRSPLEKFNREIAQHTELLDAGAISWETYARAVANAASALKGAPLRQSASQDFGSQDAYKSIVSAQFEGMQADPVKRLEDIAKAQKQLQQRQAQANEELVRLARKGFVGMGVL